MDGNGLHFSSFATILIHSMAFPTINVYSMTGNGRKCPNRFSSLV
jgi:hypothetical protein